MNSGLISDFAERASKVLCDGAISAATETVPSTVTVWDNSPTLSAMETFSAAPASSLSPVRRLVAKLGAVTSIEYVPTGRPVTENLPSVPLVVWRAEPLASFLTDTAAVAVSPDCACSRTNKHRHKASKRIQCFKTEFTLPP